MNSDNQTTFYCDSGEGEIVLLLHGWGGSHLSMQGLMNKMQSAYRVINLDLWGFGKSSIPEKDTTIYDYAENVIELLDKLNIQKVHIIGHSFGGRIGIILASRYPDRVQSLVLLDSAGIKTKLTKKQNKEIKQYKTSKSEVEKGLADPILLRKYGSQDYRDLMPDMQPIFVRVVNEDLSDLAKKIKIPTMIIWGRKDNETPKYMAKQLLKLISNSVLFWLKGGHYAYLFEQDYVIKLCYEFWGTE